MIGAANVNGLVIEKSAIYSSNKDNILPRAREAGSPLKAANQQMDKSTLALYI